MNIQACEAGDSHIKSQNELDRIGGISKIDRIPVLKLNLVNPENLVNPVQFLMVLIYQLAVARVRGLTVPFRVTTGCG